jgi:hypothetical protein
MQSVIAHSQKQAEELKTLACDRKELAALRRRLDDERTENVHLEKVNVELQQQLEEQKRELEAHKHAHQEQLKEQKKAHQGKLLLPSGTCTVWLNLDSEKLSTTELRRILISKEELLTDVKNLLYRRTDDVERLQKVIGDTEQQFVDSLQRIKALGEELEDLRGAARELVDMVDPPEEGEANPQPLLEHLRKAPKKVIEFLSEAPVTCVNNALAIVKSFLPSAQLEIFAQGMVADCTEDQFDRYLLEAQPMSERIVQSVMQD